MHMHTQKTVDYIDDSQLLMHFTGRAHLIRTWLIRSSTLLKVSVNILPYSYHFMFKMHS